LQKKNCHEEKLENSLKIVSLKMETSGTFRIPGSQSASQQLMSDHFDARELWQCARAVNKKL
jgi:hypothetical protein